MSNIFNLKIPKKPEQPKQTAVDHIFDHLYFVKLPSLQMKPVEFYREVGVLCTGDPALDSELPYQTTLTWISINTMVELFKEGVAIYLVNETDAKRIYDVISEHLLHWEGLLKHGINIGGAPLEDLIAMDNFANTVYGHAKYQMQGSGNESIFERSLMSIHAVSPLTIIKPFKDAKVEEEVQEELPERDSLKEFFATRIVNLRT